MNEEMSAGGGSAFGGNKQLIFGVIIAILLLGGFIGYNRWSESRKQASFIQEVDRKLSDEDRKIYEDRLVEAEKFIAEAQDNQAKSDALVYKAVQLSGLGKLALARDVFLEAAKVNPENFNIYVHLHQVYLEMGDYKQAESGIQKSLELKSDNPDAWTRYILLEVEKFNRPEREIRDLYAQAGEAVLEKSDIYTSYARYLEKIGDLQGAKEYWQKAIESNPTGRNIYEAEIKRIDEKLSG